MIAVEDSWSEREAGDLLDELIQREVLPESVERQVRSARSERTDLDALEVFLAECSTEE